MTAKTKKFDLKDHHRKYLRHAWRFAPFVLRITEWKDQPVPVLVMKERIQSGGALDNSQEDENEATAQRRGVLVDRAHISGDSQRRLLPVIKKILAPVTDEAGIPFELQRYMTREGLAMRLNLPLDEEAGAKLALIFRLQERLNDLDRVELIARRVARFTREEAAYWLSRITSFGTDANRWAVSGLRTMLGGQPKDKGVERMLEQLRYD